MWMSPRTRQEQRHKAMKTQQHQDQQQTRRVPCTEWQLGSLDKGRKHEAFEAGFAGGDRRNLVRAALRFDRKR